jgi:DNA polymerase-4
VCSHGIICLADLDCFFVEVERLHRPELIGRPVIIGGEPGKRGVVAACSYEARRLGVKSALPMGEAYRRVNDAGGVLRTGTAFLHTGLFGNYTRYSQRVRDVLASEVPVFRARSIDEFEMDVSGCERLLQDRHGGVLPFVEYLRRRVRSEVGLKLSVGVGPSSVVAKMASRHAKPDGVYRVLPDEVEQFLAPHDIQDVPGIGPATGAGLRARGVHTVGQLLALPQRMIGASFDLGILGVVRGLREGDNAPTRRAGSFGMDDERGLVVRRAPKSIGHETTFERDVIDPAVIEQTLWRLSEDACRRLREQDLRTRHVTVKVRYSDFKTLTHGGFLAEATDTDSAVFAQALKLYRQAKTRRLRVRLLGVRLSRFSAGASQLRLFAGKRERREESFFAAVDRIRGKHGRHSVHIGPGTSRIKRERTLAANSTAGIQSGFIPQRE